MTASKTKALRRRLVARIDRRNPHGTFGDGGSSCISRTLSLPTSKVSFGDDITLRIHFLSVLSRFHGMKIFKPNDHG